jgi:hypothetical protein
MWMFIGFKYFKWDKMCVEKRDSTGISPSSANHQPIIIGPKTQWMDVSGSPFQIPGLVDGKWRFQWENHGKTIGKWRFTLW